MQLGVVQVRGVLGIGGIPIDEVYTIGGDRVDIGRRHRAPGHTTALERKVVPPEVIGQNQNDIGWTILGRPPRGISARAPGNLLKWPHRSHSSRHTHQLQGNGRPVDVGKSAQNHQNARNNADPLESFFHLQIPFTA